MTDPVILAAATLLGAWMGRMPGAPDQAIQAWVATGLIIGAGDSLIGRLVLFDALKLRFRLPMLVETHATSGRTSSESEPSGRDLT